MTEGHGYWPAEWPEEEQAPARSGLRDGDTLEATQQRRDAVLGELELRNKSPWQLACARMKDCLPRDAAGDVIKPTTEYEAAWLADFIEDLQAVLPPPTKLRRIILNPDGTRRPINICCAEERAVGLIEDMHAAWRKRNPGKNISWLIREDADFAQKTRDLVNQAAKQFGLSARKLDRRAILDRVFKTKSSDD
jgi:hypothetical protein